MIRAIILVAAVLTSAPAFAQAKSRVLPPNVLQELNAIVPGAEKNSISAPTTIDPSKLWAQIVAALPPDLKYAKALADNVASPNSKLRSACYGALITANEQANGVNLKNADGSPMSEPSPDLVTKFEKAAELIDNLQPTAPVIVACVPAANALGQSAMALISDIMGGIAIKALIP